MLIALSLWLLDRLADFLPPAWLYRLARCAGTLLLPVFERQRQAVRSNVLRLHPDWTPPQLDTAAKRVFQERAAYYVDTVLLPRRRPQETMEKNVAVEGLDLLQDAVAAGRGVVLAGAHLSNSEVPFQTLAALDIEAVALVEPMQSKRQMTGMQARRGAAGMRFAPANMDGIRRALTLLRRGGVVAVLTDRALHDSGICLPFAGRLARFPTGAVDLAMRTDAALLIGLAVREGDDHFRVLFLPTDPLIRSDDRARDVHSNLANLIQRMEPFIVQHTQQWRMFESPWKPCHDTRYQDLSGRARPPPSARAASARKATDRV